MYYSIILEDDGTYNLLNCGNTKESMHNHLKQMEEKGELTYDPKNNVYVVESDSLPPEIPGEEIYKMMIDEKAWPYCPSMPAARELTFDEKFRDILTGMIAAYLESHFQTGVIYGAQKRIMQMIHDDNMREAQQQVAHDGEGGLYLALPQGYLESMQRKVKAYGGQP